MGELNIFNHVDLIVQLFVLSATLYGFMMFRRDQGKHARSFFLATAVNVSAIFLLMTPRLRDHLPEISFTSPSTHAIIIISHSSIGAIAAVFSILLIASWGMKDFKLGRCRRKDMMAIAFITWMLATGIGIFGYLRHLLMVE